MSLWVVETMMSQARGADGQPIVAIYTCRETVVITP